MYMDVYYISNQLTSKPNFTGNVVDLNQIKKNFSEQYTFASFNEN